MSNIKQLFEKELKNKFALKTSGHTSEETVLVKAFKYFDLDNSGQCSIDEFLKAITKIGITGFSESDLEQIFTLYDTDGSGELDYKEFVGGIFSNNSETTPAKRISKQEYLETEEVDNILQKIRSKLASRGVRGICSIARNFRIIDDNNSQSLDMNEFRKAAKDFRFGLSEQEVEKAFLAFDRDNTGIIDYDEFFRKLRGNMSDFRKRLVEQAFAILDKDWSGVIDLDEIKSVYNARRHPDVMSGKRTEDEVLLEFMETYSYLTGTNSDGKVTLEEFVEYYEGVSMSIDDDVTLRL